uniref:Uncharacterized protein n=1 Tax=Melopsittacus undulatus TaxID=13146 RepID=A0A8V5H9V7_MELUD
MSLTTAVCTRVGPRCPCPRPCPDWQVSRSLQDASREHAAEQGRLEQELSAREQRLEQTRLELARARAELGRAWRDGNSSRAALELRDVELGRARQELGELHRDVQRLQGELNSSRSTVADLRACLNTGRHCCPSGWVLYRGKCLFISVASKTWQDSLQYCQGESAQLLVQGDGAAWTMPVQSRGAAAAQGWGNAGLGRSSSSSSAGEVLGGTGRAGALGHPLGSGHGAGGQQLLSPQICAGEWSRILGCGEKQRSSRFT